MRFGSILWSVARDMFAAQVAVAVVAAVGLYIAASAVVEIRARAAVSRSLLGSAMACVQDFLPRWDGRVARACRLWLWRAANTAFVNAGWRVAQAQHEDAEVRVQALHQMAAHISCVQKGTGRQQALLTRFRARCEELLRGGAVPPDLAAALRRHLAYFADERPDAGNSPKFLQ